MEKTEQVKFEKIEQVRTQFKTNLTKTFKDVDVSNGTHINIALSISKEGLPARFLAGVIPGFVLAQAVGEQFEVDTSVRFFSPINIAVACNGLGEEDQFRSVGEKAIEQGSCLVQRLQETHFPKVNWRLTFDQSWNDGAKDLLTTIWDRSAQLSLEPNGEQLTQARESILQRGKSNAHLYMPHHLFGWQDCFSPFIFADDDKPKENELVINCMSESERNFQMFRKRLAWDMQVTRPELVLARAPIDVMTERCPGPHYIRSQDGERIEPSIEDLFSHGFTNIVRNLANLMNENERFKTAKNDMLSIFNFFHERWLEDANLPTLDEFIKGAI